MSSTNSGPSITTTPNIVVQAVPAGGSTSGFDPSSVAITGGTINGVPTSGFRVMGVTPVGLPSNVSHCGVGTMTQFTGAGKASTLWQETVMLPCGVDAVSICPLQNVADVSTYTGILGYVQTTDATGAGADLKNPYFQTAVQTMQQVTWGGATSPTFIATADAQKMVGPWSDWIPVVNTGTGAPSYLILRMWYPAGVAATGGYYQTDRQGGRVAKLVALGANAAYGSAGSNVGASNAAAIGIGGTVALPVLARFATSKRVATIANYGDSTRQGWYGDGIVSAIERVAISRSLAGLPTASNNRGITGQTSAQYLARLVSDVAAGDRFDVLVWQVATPNDAQTSTTSQQQIANAHAAIRVAQSIGARVVLEGPFPITAGTPNATQTAIVTGARTFCQAMDGIRPGISSVFYESLHDPANYGKWIAAYNNAGDGLHQNETATTAVIVPQMSAAITTALTGL